jgi:methylthioribose-1-phosphate isomerase
MVAVVVVIVILVVVVVVIVIAVPVCAECHGLGKGIHVWVDETRPRLQGAKLTAWELMRAKVPMHLIADNAAGHLMSTGKVRATAACVAVVCVVAPTAVVGWGVAGQRRAVRRRPRRRQR